MAININAGEVGRGDVFFIDPHEIIVDEKLNGRWEPHDEAAITSLAWPHTSGPIALMWVICTGICASRPTRMDSSVEPIRPMV